MRGAACVEGCCIILGDSAQVVGRREGRRRKKKRKEEAKDVGGGVGWRRKGTFFLIALF